MNGVPGPRPVAATSATPAQVGVLDAHVHFWDPHRFTYPWLSSVPALNRSFLPEHLVTDGDRRRFVVVQADCLPEHGPAEGEWFRGLAEAGAPIVGTVVHVPLEEGAAAGPRIDGLVEAPLVAGVRRLLQDEGTGFALGEGFLAGTRLLAQAGVPLDLCVRSHQLPEVTELVRRRPDLSCVLDHLGKPQISPEGFRSWSADLGRLAALPNVTCKLSGLATEADPAHRTRADLVPFLREAIDAFGPRRCMFGSDWPVLVTAMSYRQWLDVVSEAIDDLPAGEQLDILGRTAEAVYGLGGTGVPGGSDAAG